MKSDIQIAQAAKKEDIRKIAQKIEIPEEELELFGSSKAKLQPKIWKRIKNKRDGRLVLVTAINPTPAGEGKTTTSIGLAQAFARLGEKAVLAIREPSLGPCMGIKGGAAGGGYSQVVPMEEINLHFTGDMHAITSANNLLSAIIDNHIFQGNELGIDVRRILWKRAVDLNDRALRQVVVGLGGKTQGVPREDGFNITVASEIMAILCLAKDIQDLKKKLGNIIVGYSFKNKPIFCRDLKAVGAMAALLKDALKPNLIQTLENTPVIMHGGPFANIAHGCNSIIATKYAMKLGDYAITEAGFGADLGAEKFFNIKCRKAGLKPDAVVLVATIRSLKYNGGVELEKLSKENLKALRQGIVNLEKHIENIKKFGLPLVVAINVFPTDTQKEIDWILNFCRKRKVACASSRIWAEGGKGGEELAEKLLEVLKKKQSRFKLLYSDKLSIEKKIEKVAKEVYGARGVEFSAKAKKQLQEIEEFGFGNFPVCMAKNQYSLSDDPKLLGRPENFIVSVKELRISSGAGFIVALLGEIMTMPGLPKIPAAEKVDIDAKGKIKGLF